MKLIIHILFLILFGFDFISIKVEASEKPILVDVFSLPSRLSDFNYQYVQHSMDVILSDNQFQLIFGKMSSKSNILRLSLVVLEVDNHFYGEVKLYDSRKKEYFAVVPVEFKSPDDSIEKIRLAVTEAILGKQYMQDNMFAIKEKAKVRYTPREGAKPLDVIDTDEVEDVELESKIFDKILIPNKLKKKSKKAKIEPRKNKIITAEKNQLKVKGAGGQETLKENNKESLEMVNLKEVVPVGIVADKIVPVRPTEENKKKFYIDAFVFAGQLQIVTEKNIKITTTIGHVGLGARARFVELNKERPRSFSTELQISKPMKRDNYSIPLWRKLDFSADQVTKISNIKLGGGLELEPLYFIALPNYGKGLTVVDNNIYWLYLSSEFQTHRWKDWYTLKLKLSRSIYTSSSTETKLSGFKFNSTFHIYLNQLYSLDFNFQRSFLTDDLNKANNQMITLMLRRVF